MTVMKIAATIPAFQPERIRVMLKTTGIIPRLIRIGTNEEMKIRSMRWEAPITRHRTDARKGNAGPQSTFFPNG